MLLNVSVFFSSCAIKVKQINPHQESFALVKTSVEVKIYNCSKLENEKKEKCGYQSMGKAAALGSGTFFIYKNKLAFLTAGHVCLGPAYEVWENLTPGSRVIHELQLESYTGHHIKGKVAYVNLKYDLCVIEAFHPTIKRVPKISLIGLKLNEEYYSVSAPVSIFNTGMVPVLRGLYVGDGHTFSFFTIPAAPGASGGPIYNSNNRIVGIVQRTHTAFQHITLSIKHKDLKDILDRYVEMKKQGINSIVE